MSVNFTKLHLVFFMAVVCCFLVPSLVVGMSNQTGTSAMAFTKLSHSVKSVSVGNSLTAAEGMDALTLNPSSIARLEDPELDAQVVNHVVGMSYKTLSFGLPTSFGNLAAHVGQMDYGSQLRTTFADRGGSSGQTFSNYGLQAIAAYAKQLSHLRFGTAIRYAAETLDSRKASSVGADFGLGYSWSPDIDIALSLTNVTLKKAKFVVEESDLPQNISAGLMYRCLIHDDPVNLSFSVNQPSDANVNISLGADMLLGDFLFLRAGLSNLDEKNMFSLGVGLRLRTLTVDFSYQPIDKLGASYRFGLGMTM